MYIIKTAKGTEIEADSVARGTQFPVLHIHTHAITPIQAYQIFGDAEESKEITVYDWYYDVTEETSFRQGVTYYERIGENTFVETKDVEMQEGKLYFLKYDLPPKVYHDFTEIYSVQKSPVVAGENEIMIWLQRPMRDYD